MMQVDKVDLLVIGGGINGVGVALDAVGRGLTVMLCEKDDLASHTSSASSKLIHGGLRYLEHCQFKLVRESLTEREILLRLAPHLVHPLEFILPQDSTLRSRWLLQLGLFLYDHLGHHHLLPKSRKIHFKHTNGNHFLQSKFKQGFSYFDCSVDDARLVVTVAMQARKLGAVIKTRTQVLEAVRENNGWQVKILDRKTKQIASVHATALVNATGAWVSSVLQEVTKTACTAQVKLVKGSHLVVPKLYDGDFAYILQTSDQRVVFVIPYQQRYSLIGTTDVLYSDDPETVRISQAEIEYLLNTLSQYSNRIPSASDVVWSYSGIRALYDDHKKEPSAITRDYYLELQDQQGACPILSIFGGKLTTYRVLAEQAVNKLKTYFPAMSRPWTSHAVLPGGDLPEQNYKKFVTSLLAQYPNFPANLLERYARNYGSQTCILLAEAKRITDLGAEIIPGLYTQEIDYLMQQEWAQSAEDILWRRTKLGIGCSETQVLQLQQYIQRR